MKIECNKLNPPLGGLLAVEYYRASANIIEVEWTDDTSITLPGSNETLYYGTSNDLIRILENFFNKSADPLQRVTMNHWLSFGLTLNDDIQKSIEYLDKILAPLTYLVGESLSVSDLAVYSALYVSSKFKEVTKGNPPKNLQRWMKLIEVQGSVIKVLNELPPEVFQILNKTPTRRSPPKNNENAPARQQEGKFIELPHAEMGKVVVRFPPEASGYLHIGHAKAALLNQYYQQAFQGKLIMRFDDTNPAKENIEFEKVILEDVKMLEIIPDKFTYTSQYFDLMLEYCEKLILEGKAYVDDTPAEQMKTERDQKIESKHRNNTVDVNLKMWEEMKKGSEAGTMSCVRAKIDMQSDNGCMRDPTIYRCKPESHPRTGNKYKVYPTYDFACPIVDSIEGVTHVLRTMEYHDRDPQFYWFIDALGIRKPYIWEYSRLSMTNTVLSKRKLTWFVEQGLVDGWDDPRMPTVRGVLRRGMTVEALRQFIHAQGSSRSVVFMEWDKIWAINKKVIDPIAPRYTALELEPVPVNLAGVTSDNCMSVQLHPKNPEVGMKSMWVSPTLLIDRVDAETLKEGENTTFINYGNVMIDKINRSADGKITSIDGTPNLENKDYKKTLKVTWLAHSPQASTLEVYCVFFDHIISKAVLSKDEDFKQYIGHQTRWETAMLGEPAMSSLKKGDIVQLQRRGFFRVERAARPQSAQSARAAPLVLLHVPDGHTKDMPGQKAKPATEKAATAAVPKKEQPAKTNGDVTKEVSKWSIKPETLNKDIIKQGNLVRSLKAAGSEKSVIDEAVKVLLDLKAQFKEISGKHWALGFEDDSEKKNRVLAKLSPELERKKATLEKKISSQQEKLNALVLGQAKKPLYQAADSDADTMSSSIYDDVTKQGDVVRALKANKADKAAIEAEVKKLLQLKQKYETDTGISYIPPGAKNAKPKEQEKGKGAKPKEAKLKEDLGESSKSSKDDGPSGAKKVTRLGLEASKEKDLPEWYSQVITKSEMIDYYDISGCYILRPWSFSIWDSIRGFLSPEFKKLGVKDGYFPIFVSKSALEREKTHIADFAPEVAWVTHSGSSELAEHIAVRPTSETVMYPAYARWIQSHRDLPLKLNQWNNVVRWEFKQPQPFLRTREFLWQEGHTAYRTKEEATDEVLQILDLYARVYEDLLAIPVIKGRKTEKEKFAGADFTTTVEAYVPASGRAIQGATSHHLGQNFSKMFEIVFDDAETHEKNYVYQNSWGITTRTIGVMVLVHGDDKGLVLPPRIAEIQAIVVPCGITASSTPEERKALMDSCKALVEDLTAAGIRSEGDYRDNYSPGWKFNHWELKGVPVRVELGPKDMAKGEVVAVQRFGGEKMTLKREEAGKEIVALLERTHGQMLEKATKERDARLTMTKKWAEFVFRLEKKHIILAPFCGDIICEDAIKADSTRLDDDPAEEAKGPSMGAKSLCIPFKQPRELTEDDRCIHPSCTKKPKFITLFGRSY